MNEDVNSEFNTIVRAINDMYAFLYKQGVLKEKSFVSKDLEDAFYFAVDTSDLEFYREEMLNSGVENAELAVKHIFDENHTECFYCGAITLSWTMSTYRDNCGCVGRSWECCGCEGFHTRDVSKFNQIRKEKSIAEAVKYQWSLFKWKEYSEDGMELVQDNVKVVFENLGEGYNGDYNENDPEDENLLRFTVYVKDGEIWEQVDDASYCTLVSADTEKEKLQELLNMLMDEFYAVLHDDIHASVKKLGERLSHIS